MRKSRRIASFLMLSTEVGQHCFVVDVAARPTGQEVDRRTGGEQDP